MTTHRYSRRSFLGQSAAGLAAAAAPGLFTGCSNAPARQTLKEVPDRLILLTLDTLRWDHMEYFGYPRSTSPFLSFLAERSVVFENAYCACSNTTPSHASMFSGLHLPQHKMYHNAYDELTPGVFTMAEMLQDAGYQTAAFCSTVWMKQFQRGFQQFETCWEKYVQDDSERRYYYQAPKTVSLAIDWLKQRRPEDKFFLWVHLYDPHDPYIAPEQYQEAMRLKTPQEEEKFYTYWTETQKKRITTWPYNGKRDAFIDVQNGYDSEIMHMDAAIRSLYGYCQQSGLNQNALWLATADHGEGLGAHDYHGHGMHIYEEQTRCFTILHAPDGRFAPNHIQELVHHVDLMPTVAAVYKTSLAKQQMPIQGLSLESLLAGDKTLEREFLYCQRRSTIETNFSKDWEVGPVYSVQNRDYKYIYHEQQPHELYDLRDDPHELNNLIGEELPVKERMLTQAKTTFEALSKSGEGAVEQGVSHEHDDALKALGYL